MKSKRNKYLIFATAIVGCGLCCLPFLFPVAIASLGISIGAFTADQIICGSIFLLIAITLAVIYLKRRAKKSCELPHDV